ncbi:MAG TPA: alpha/beta fold hydrolase [Candidatus Limnocylindrales bacterium]|nr:alpha/beta fold hydrolase [Candidatus Limnocylindrales bacterium]
MRELRVGRTSRRRYELDPDLGPAGEIVVERPVAARRLAARLNDRAAGGAPTAHPGEIVALGLLHEVGHALIDRYERDVRPTLFRDVLDEVDEAIGRRPVDDVLGRLASEFGEEPERTDLLESLLLLEVAAENPAATPIRPLVDPGPVARAKAYEAVTRAVDGVLGAEGDLDGSGESLADMLRAPARHSPTSLAGQLRYARERWAAILPADLTARLLAGEDLLAEEERALHLRFGGGGPGGGGEAPSFAGADAELERFSDDRDWMPRLVLIAKSTYVWLDQLSRRYGREIRTLDAIPDEELDALARRGITGLWLIGLWQRSRASEKIKRWRGNPEAVASAYSLDDYRIADDLGGDAAHANLRERAATRGIRLASDMVPNHMGIDSRWVIDHPERFISLAEPPFPAYTFGGENLADDDRVEIRIEDHYWDDSDAAVVFERRDRATGERRYVYHGNDGTSFPWNDTAQLDYLRADVREAVIQTILEVARRFPVIRFDAAMVLAKKHVERLWWPEPGHAGAIPSRSEHAIPREEFDRLMPNEFWREVVDRVAAEAPDTLLLAEAFWLLEGYFVRTLGMHRVYNSAFMHMLRDEDNAGYRKVIRDTVEFDPEILKRYVNFMTNPDEETAIEQFGTGDKYFGIATLLATMPGLPMIGHGQLEGFTEKYGMEYRRAYRDEQPNEGLLAHFEAQIAPLLHDRWRYAGAEDFRLYDVVADGGGVLDDVYAYSNGRGDARSLIVYHNRFGEAAGWIRESVPFAVKAPDGSKSVRRQTLADALQLSGPDDGWLRIRDRRAGRETLRSLGELRSRGLFVQLDAYRSMVLDEIREVSSTADEPWADVAARIGGGWVASLDDELAAVRRPPSVERDITAVPERESSLRLGDGRRVAIAEWGPRDGRPVFLLHGMPGSRHLCPDATVTREAGVRLIAPDRPGYGGSDPSPGRTVADGAADIAEIAAQLGIDRFSVVGWSSGGPYALALAALHPERIDAVALVASDAPTEEYPALLDEQPEASRARIARLRAGDPGAVAALEDRIAPYVERPGSILPDDGPDAPADLTPVARAAMTAMLETAFEQGAAGFRDDLVATYLPWGFRLADVRRPVDIWWGDADQLTSRATTDALVDGLADVARVHIVPGAGHGLASTHWRDVLTNLFELADRGGTS